MVASPNVGFFPHAILAVDLANCDLFPVFLKEAWDLVTPINKMS